MPGSGRRPLPRAGLSIALLVLASAGAWGLAQRPDPVTVFELGAADDAHVRMRARWFEYVLADALGDVDVRVSGERRLRLEITGAGARLDPHRPLAAQVADLLERHRDRSPADGGAPPTRAAFEHRHDVAAWPCETVTDSLAKPLPRRICRHPDGSAAVAYTLLPDGAVRETEIAVARTEGTGFDFIVYDETGDLARRADFGDAGTSRWLPAPQSCAACHYDARRETFARRPTFAAARLAIAGDDAATPRERVSTEVDPR